MMSQIIKYDVCHKLKLLHAILAMAAIRSPSATLFTLEMQLI